MIKTLMLIFSPAATWDRIAAAQRSVLFVLFCFLLPFQIISSAVEGYGLLRWGEKHGELGRIIKPSQDLMLRYEVTQIVLTVFAVFFVAFVMNSLMKGFHQYTRYANCFVAVAYSIGPLLFAQMIDGLPATNTWVCWGVGMILSVIALYHGLPRVVKPDLTQALGMHVASVFLLVGLSGLIHFVAVMVLRGKVLKDSFF